MRPPMQAYEADSHSQGDRRPIGRPPGVEPLQNADIGCNPGLAASIGLHWGGLPLQGDKAVAYRHEVLTSCSRKLALICGLLLLAVGQAWSAGAPNAPQIKQASVNGVTLVYEEQGDGAPMVFIHGCCTDYRAWDAQRQAIAPHYRFIGLNLRYHGTAPWPDDGSKYSHQTHADDIAAFIRGLNAGPVDLVGWSYSGLMVMLVAAQHPELVHSLTIHEPGSLSFITDPASLKIAGEDRQAMLAPAIAAAKAGDAAGAARLVPIGVNHQPDFWDTATPDTRSMFADNARTIPLAFITAPRRRYAAFLPHCGGGSGRLHSRRAACHHTRRPPSGDRPAARRVQRGVAAIPRKGGFTAETLISTRRLHLA